MACLKLWLCLFLIFLSPFAKCETAMPLPKFFSRNRRALIMMKTAREVLEESVERQQTNNVKYFARISPGGPDPHHH